MEKKILEGKNLEEIQTKAIELFKEPIERLQIDVINEKKGFLGIGSLITAEVSLNVNPAEEGLNFLKKLIAEMGIEAKVEMFINEDEIKYNIYSDNNPLLIGRGGNTIDALQTLVRQVVSHYSQNRTICLVDVGGYKQKRKMQLEILATKVAKEVARTKIEVKLDPMNSYERRVVHTKLSEWRDVHTESVGEEPNRCLVIKPRRR
jgi:spoIIIJ-associated protein